jgi:hypothetical protein
MSSIWKHPKSPFWTACFTDGNGKQVKRSTKLRDPKLAMEAARNLERLASGSLDIARAKDALMKIIENMPQSKQ